MKWDIILELEKMAIDGKCDYKFLQTLLEKIKNIFSADGCCWYRSMREEDKVETEGYFDSNDCYYVLGNVNTSGVLKIVNPDKRVVNDSKLLDFLEIYLSNVNKLSKIILDYESKLYCDSLTGVYNNEALIYRLSSNDKFNNVGVLFVDANGLGVINNTYGHAYGDIMLKTIADCISDFFRRDDIYRKGGDEFVVICSDISKEMFLKKIEFVKYKLSLTEYSASFGYAYGDNVDDIDSLIKVADKNMFIDKEEYRKNNISKYSVKIKR